MPLTSLGELVWGNWFAPQHFDFLINPFFDFRLPISVVWVIIKQDLHVTVLGKSCVVWISLFKVVDESSVCNVTSVQTTAPPPPPPGHTREFDILNRYYDGRIDLSRNIAKCLMFSSVVDLVPYANIFVFIDCENNPFLKKLIMIIILNLHRGTKLSGWLCHY